MAESGNCPNAIDENLSYKVCKKYTKWFMGYVSSPCTYKLDFIMNQWGQKLEIFLLALTENLPCCISTKFMKRFMGYIEITHAGCYAEWSLLWVSIAEYHNSSRNFIKSLQNRIVRKSVERVRP
jgi:hypothetical protein